MEDDERSIMSDVSDVTSPDDIGQTMLKDSQQSSPPTMSLHLLQTSDPISSHVSSVRESEYSHLLGGENLAFNPVSSVSVTYSQSKNDRSFLIVSSP